MKEYILIAFILAFVRANADVDPLPSWNEGSAKARIIQFIVDVTSEGSEYFVPVAERIATFDNDGTLWVEHPLYTQFIFGIDKVKSLLPFHPEWQNNASFNHLLSNNNNLITQLAEPELAKLLAISHTGLTVESYLQIASEWLNTTIQPRFQKLYTELVYQPMLEVMDLLRANGFEVYIVSGGGQEFIRAFAENVYGVPPEHVIGTAGKTKYEYINGQPALVKLPEIYYMDDKEGKPISINLFIGRRPLAAFGNSNGDQQMLEWTQGGNGKRLELLVHHDDAVREYAYGPNTLVGTFSDALMQEATSRDWIVVSMKNDWKVIFPWEYNQN